MSKNITNADLLAALESLAEGQAHLGARVAALEVLADAPAVKERKTAPAKARKTGAKTAPAKADPKFRTAKQKDAAKAKCAKLWEKTLADAGVKRAKDLTDEQMAAYRAGTRAIWAATKGTRKTKAPKA